MAVKRVNRKRIELTREVLFELKHVMCGGREAVAWGRIWGYGEVGPQKQHGGTSEYPRKGWALEPWEGPLHFVSRITDGRRAPGDFLGAPLDGLRKQREEGADSGDRFF